jgi:hypothetical protein
MPQSASFLPHWLPAVLCGVLGLVVLPGLALRVSRGGKAIEWWQPALFGILPACFVAMALVTYRMDRQIVQLQGQLQALESATPERTVAYLQEERQAAQAAAPSLISN